MLMIVCMLRSNLFILTASMIPLNISEGLFQIIFDDRAAQTLAKIANWHPEFPGKFRWFLRNTMPSPRIMIS
jgi:hypothetical protein